MCDMSFIQNNTRITAHAGAAIHRSYLVLRDHFYGGVLESLVYACPSPCWTVCGGLQRGWATSREQTSDASGHPDEQETQQRQTIIVTGCCWHSGKMFLMEEDTNLCLKLPVQLWEQSSICFSSLLQHCTDIKEKESFSQRSASKMFTDEQAHVLS